jgi:CBS-domain-containing membrane protein
LARRLFEERIGAVPVVDGEGNVMGIISYVDVLRCVGAALESSGAPGERRQTTERAE